MHVNEKSQKEESNETLGTRIIQMGLDFVTKHDIPSILVLDAFFSLEEQYSNWLNLCGPSDIDAHCLP